MASSAVTAQSMSHPPRHPEPPAALLQFRQPMPHLCVCTQVSRPRLPSSYRLRWPLLQAVLRLNTASRLPEESHGVRLSRMRFGLGEAQTVFLQRRYRSPVELPWESGVPHRPPSFRALARSSLV